MHCITSNYPSVHLDYTLPCALNMGHLCISWDLQVPGNSAGFPPATHAQNRDFDHKSTMNYRGVVYDVGLKFNDQGFSVEPFDLALVEHDMHVIAKDLHANAVRVESEEVQRLATAARAAHSMGLTVFFNPWKMNADVDETRAYFEEAAQTAEQLRNEGVDIVFVAGCEYKIFSKGVFPDDSFNERGAWFGAQLPGGYTLEDIPETVREKSTKLNEILQSFAEAICTKFAGPLTYSAGTWEIVDWSIFDIVGIDYRR